jgi:hypothetical protein
MRNQVIILFVLSLLILPALIPSSPALFNRKPTIRVAIIRQNWDFLDKSPTSKLSTLVHTHCLKREAKRYGINVKVFEFWDSWAHGDVQSGKLRWKGIDTI